MQDRSYVIAIAVVLAICCLGVYVAVSGAMNLRNPISAITHEAPAAAATLIVVVAPTDTPVLPLAGLTLMPTMTPPPVPSPLGAFQTLTAPLASTRAPTAPLFPTLAPIAPPPTPAVQSCSSFLFCPSGGPPDASLAPTGDQCPRNYVWGRVVDAGGNGLVGLRVRFKTPLGSLDSAETKGPPDPAGIYNIIAPPPGGNWVLWVLDSGGGQASPQYTVAAPQVYGGAGNCPTRVDFRAQR